jgi:hypothetical protein
MIRRVFHGNLKNPFPKFHLRYDLGKEKRREKMKPVFT